MRFTTLFLLVLLAVLQYALWFGKGGWLRVGSLDRDIHAEERKQDLLRQENAVGHADVDDLRSGLDAIEERARHEIGMVRRDETFFQYPQTPSANDAQPKDPTPPPAAPR